MNGMIAYLDDVTGHLDSFIASRYEFRQNLVQKILDGEVMGIPPARVEFLVTSFKIYPKGAQ